MSSFGLPVKITEGTNDGPPIKGATVTGTIEPAVSGDDGVATVEAVRITVTAPGYQSYVDQRYERPSLESPVTVSLQRV
jgi:hypothetical protein